MFTITDMLVLILVMSGTFAVMCVAADYAIPSAILLRRRRDKARRYRGTLAPMMSEEYRQ